MNQYTAGSVSALVSSKIKCKSDRSLELLFKTGNVLKQKISTLKPGLCEQESKKRKASAKESKGKIKRKRKESVINDLSHPPGYNPPSGIIHEALLKDNDEPKLFRKETYMDEVDDTDDTDFTINRRQFDTLMKSKKHDPRTVFVGNLPIEYNKKEIQKLFKEFGKIESIRVRSATPASLNIPKKVAVIKKDFKEGSNFVNGYLVFESEDAAKNALERNGALIAGHHIRVDLISKNKALDHKHTVFVGNLPLDVNNDDVWNIFEECGEITNVRVVRDKATGVGKGIGFITFQDSSSVTLALKLNASKLKGRSLRITQSVKKQKDKMKNKKSRMKQNSQRDTKITNVSNKKFTKPSNIARGTFNEHKSIKNKKLKKKKEWKLKSKASSKKSKNRNK